MLVASHLARSTLGDVLGQLHRAKVTGVLVLEETGARTGCVHAIHLFEGSPRAISSQGPRLGELLTERGGRARGRLADAVAQQREGDPRLMGEVLCELGEEPRAVEDTMEQQTRARLEPLYALPDARVRFHSALFDDVAPRAWVKAARAARPLSPSAFLHGRPRAKPRDTAADERRELLRLLDVAEGASAATLREAFKRRVHELHPDRPMSDEQRATRTKTLARLLGLYQRITG